MGSLLSRHGGSNDHPCLSSAAAIGYVRAGPCTSTGPDHLCAIFERVEALNDCLRPIGLELTEVLPGRLSLAWYEAPWVVPEIQNASRYQPRRPEEYQNLAGRGDNPGLTEQDRLRALCVVQDVLRNHHCVVSVDVVGHAFEGHDELIADALTRAGPTLRALRIRSVYRVSQALVDYLGNAIGSLSRLQELVWTHDKLQRCPSNKLLSFLRMTTTLTTMELTEVHMPAPHAATLFRALKRNKSLKTLCLSACLVISDPSVTSSIVRDYVSSRECGLLSLTVRRSCTSYPPSLKDIVHGVCTNKKLQELSVAGFFLGRWNFGVIAKLLMENQTLRRITLIGTSWFEAFQGRFECRERWKKCDREGPNDFSRCLRGIACHKSLEQLAVDISTFTISECLSLCKAVRANKVLRTVTLARIHNEDVGAICDIIRQTDTADRIRLDHSYVVKERSDDLLVEYPGLIKAVVMDAVIFRDSQFFGKSLGLLPRCADITSLSLGISNARLFDADAQSTVAKFLETTTKLRTLELRLPVSGVPHGSHGSLVQALSKNRSLRTLLLHRMRLTQDDTRRLALAVTGSRTLCDLGFFVSESDLAVLGVFLSELESCFADNYTMLQLRHSRVDEWMGYLDIQRVIRRNRALAMRASHFVMGVTQSKGCARALEEVSTGQGVVKEVAEFAGLDEATAAAVVNQALEVLVDMDGYMRAAGVVRNSVICRLESEDCSPTVQLDGLDADSWRHVRQYLKLADVVDSECHAPQ